jgi:hypothetical protein
MRDPILCSEAAQRLTLGSLLDLRPQFWRETMASSLRKPLE